MLVGQAGRQEEKEGISEVCNQQSTEVGQTGITVLMWFSHHRGREGRIFLWGERDLRLVLAGWWWRGEEDGIYVFFFCRGAGVSCPVP